MTPPVIARRATAPASSANLGPGFDALAVALSLHVTVTVRPSASLSVEASGEGADLPADASHLAARVVSDVLGHDRVAIGIESRIPVARGLGSSAALAAAAAAAAGSEDPLAEAARLDGHPENAAASVLGGLVAASQIDGRVTALRLPLDPTLAFVVVIPDRELPTAEARAALPASVPLGDAASNLGRLALLIGALGDASRLTSDLMADRLHQPHRAKLMPEAAEILDLLLACGARAAAWSGAGPTMLGVVERASAEAVLEALRPRLEAGPGGDAHLLTPDMRGLYVAEA